jgi:putative membrane protein
MTDGGPIPNANQLAQTRTDLAGDRTMMAADRTLMAWIRTALSMISFGFAIYKFLSSMKESAGAAVHTHNPEGPRRLGLLLTALGTASLAAGVLQYIQVLRQIGANLRSRVSFYVACIVVALGLMILIGMAAQRGPF